jgi:hypothetical protein
MRDPLKYFMYDTSNRIDITVDDAVKVELEEALNLFFKLSHLKGNYIGFVINDTQILQFMSVGVPNSYLLDIPDVDQKGSLQKMTDFEECRSVLVSLCSGSTLYEIKGVTFKKW